MAARYEISLLVLKPTFHSALKYSKNSKTTTQQMTTALWTITGVFNIPSNPEFATDK